MDRYVTRNDGVTAFRKGKVRPKLLNTDGYVQSKLCKNGKYKTVRIHRLVAEHFLPNPNNLPEVNHKDCNRANNMIDNLEWCTHTENIHHTLKHGNHFCQTNIYGCNNPNYGNHILSKMYKNNPELAKEKLSRPCGQNGRAKSVQLFDRHHQFIKQFDWIGGCANYLIENGFAKTKKVETIRNNISKYSKSQKTCYGFYYKII